MTNESLFFIEEVIVISLLIASIVAIVTRRLRVPYTVGLVIIGFIITLIAPQKFTFSPQIILALLVPPLIFEAAFHIRFDDLRRDIWLILLLVVPGVILTTFMVGWVVSLGTGLTLSAALVFGALVAATDPVAIVALFRRLGAPRRLQVLLEAESLFNDGTAIVMFGVMLGIALDGHFNFLQGVGQFFTIAGGGILVGAVCGAVFSQFINRIDEPLVEATLTTVIAFGSYLVAELLHVSGVLAVVVAGIVTGNVSSRAMSATTRIVVLNFWDYAAFIANSFIFLLIGLAIDLNSLVENWQAIGWAILAALLARAASVYGFSLFAREISTKWKHVLFWGGLRGAITLALALSLPREGIFADERGRLQAMAFGLTLFTLLVQGISMNWLTRTLNLIQRSPAQDEYELRHARLVTSNASHEYLRRRTQEGLISEHVWEKISNELKEQSNSLTESLKKAMSSDPIVEAEELDTVRREGLRAQRAALTGLLRDGVITEQTYDALLGEIDSALMNVDNDPKF